MLDRTDLDADVVKDDVEPVLPREALDSLADDGVIDQPKHRRRRPRRSGNGSEMSVSDIDDESGEADLDATIADPDTWLASFNWDRPGMRSKLKRLAPEWTPSGQPAAGELETRQGAGFSVDEVRSRYGGGEFEVFVFGPRKTRGGLEKILALGRKRFKIPGDPTLPAGTQLRGREANGPLERPDSVVNILDKQTAFLQRGMERALSGSEAGHSTLQLMDQNYEKSVQTITEAARERADAQVAAAESRAREAIERERAALERANALERELRAKDEQVYMERETTHKTIEERVAAAHNQGNNLLATLLPLFKDSAESQSKTLIQTSESRAAQERAAHEAQVSMLMQNHQAELNSLRTLHQAELRRVESLMESTVGVLRAQVQTLEGKLETTTKQLDIARNDAEKARMEMLTQLSTVKNKSAIDQLGELAQFKEMISAFSGTGSGEDSEEAGGPIAKAFKSIVDRVGPSIPDLIQAYTARNGPPGSAPGMPPALPPAMMQPPPYAMMPAFPPPPPGAQAMGAPPRPAAPPPKPKGPPRPKLSREDLEKAVTLVNDVLRTAPETTPEELANTATAFVPRSMLWELARRPTDRLIDELLQKGVIPAGTPLASPSGRDYLTRMLAAIRQDLAKPPVHEPPVLESEP